jgi:uncharacterized protein
MLDNQTKNAIETLFGKLEQVERQGPDRDAEAEGLISARIARQPGAPYYMAQTIVVQEQALEAAQRRIEELERSSGGGGVLGSFFGGRRPPAPMARPDRMADAGPWSQGAVPAGRGGGFLAGAAQTAMGVAGGVLLGNAVAGMFGGDEAKAAEAPATSDQPEEAGAGDEGGGFFDSFFGGDEDE